MAWLLTGTLMSVLGPVNRGKSNPLKCNVQTPGGETVQVYVKPSGGEERILAEALASMIGLKLGLPVARPMVVKVTDSSLGLAKGHHFGSVALPYPDLAKMIDAKGPKLASKMKKWPHVLGSACFDEWVANNDRHNGNILFDGAGGYWLIDHDRVMLTPEMPDSPNQFNELFELLVKGAADAVMRKLRSETQIVMKSYEASSFDDLISECAKVFSGSALDRFSEFLTARQPELDRLGMVWMGKYSKQGSFFE